jgi:hypothetical protein
VVSHEKEGQPPSVEISTDALPPQVVMECLGEIRGRSGTRSVTVEAVRGVTGAGPSAGLARLLCPGVFGVFGGDFLLLGGVLFLRAEGSAVAEAAGRSADASGRSADASSSALRFRMPAQECCRCK